ncbi:MAG: DUF2845 domain-containing protein [Pseudomonas sp.]|nr:DUF2845 domain-containing protein [Pseudomonas sp.]
MKTAVCLGLVLLALTGNAQATSTLRCGSALISVEDSMGEVARKCGEPASRTFMGYRQGGYYGPPQVPIEQWVYGPNNGMLQYLRFEGGRLVTIDSKRGD